MNLKEEIIFTMHGAGKPLKSSEISDILKVDKKEVDKAIKELMIGGLVESPKRSYYTAKTHL